MPIIRPKKPLDQKTLIESSIAYNEKLAKKEKREAALKRRIITIDIQFTIHFRKMYKGCRELKPFIGSLRWVYIKKALKGAI